MLGVIEKSLWVLTVLVLLAVGGWFAIAGPPSTAPWIATGTQENDAVTFDKGITKEMRDNRRKLEKELDKPKNGKPAARRTKKHYAVNQALFERVMNRTDALREARRAHGEKKVNKDGSVSIVITDFGENSIFERLGVVENDEIQSVNGLPMDISEYDALKAYDAFKQKFEGGEPIYLDIKRKGKPMRLWFRPDWLVQ